MNCTIMMRWDDEARVWIATSKNVPGLVLEDSTFEALVEEVKLAVPTLLRLNGIACTDAELDFVCRRQERLAMVG